MNIETLVYQQFERVLKRNVPFDPEVFEHKVSILFVSHNNDCLEEVEINYDPIEDMYNVEVDINKIANMYKRLDYDTFYLNLNIMLYSIAVQLNILHKSRGYSMS